MSIDTDDVSYETFPTSHKDKAPYQYFVGVHDSARKEIKMVDAQRIYPIVQVVKIVQERDLKNQNSS